MSFEITPTEGTAQELSVDLSKPTQHEREDTVMPVITKAITEVVEALGGYLSVSANGNINPVSGETGDLVQIYITSLPAPQSVTSPAETSPVEEVQTGEPISVTEESPQPQPVVTPENTEPAQQAPFPAPPPTEEILQSQQQPLAPIGGENSTEDEPVVVSSIPAATPAEALPVDITPLIQENPVATDPAPAPENPAEKTPEVSPEQNTTSIGQVEAQEIAQATPPVEPAA